jgi:hypothetical protein
MKFKSRAFVRLHAFELSDAKDSNPGEQEPDQPQGCKIKPASENVR